MAQFKQHPLYTNFYVSKEGTFYYIRSDGTKSSIRNGTLSKNKFGKPLCYEVCITVSRGTYKVMNVGRLVLETYVGFAPEDAPEVDHRDRDPLNNKLDNLQWVSRADNLKNRVMPHNPWKDDRQAKRLETARKLGYNTWGDLLRAGRAKAKAEREQNGKTLSVQHDA